MNGTGGTVGERLLPLVAALEGRVFRGSTSWVAHVHGVHSDERAWWIQVARADDDAASVVLRCSPYATVEHAAAVLLHWQACREHTLRVINVMAVA